MRKFFTTIPFFFTLLSCLCQVKSSYLYNSTMPYGTLDIRTYISSTNYYYLQEGKTVAFRESSPGVRTNHFLDMTSWDSSPYKQGNLRHKTDTKDIFVMNYRLLAPLHYSTAYADGYPMIVIVHGAVERGNCYYNNCYHANWDYDPNVNSPPAPITSTHKLLNNDHHLSIGGKQHLDARNLAAGKLPNDPTLAPRAFPGFILMAQMMNVWDANSIQDLIRIVQLHCKKYKIDQNRIYIHGLSIGGYGVYEAIKRAPWLFAAALPMSAVSDANVFKENLQSKTAHIPYWVFQGGLDTNPTPSYTNTLVNNLRKAGAIVRYSLYSDLGHAVWNRAYGEADFFKWILAKSKSNIHVYAGKTTINRSLNQYPKLMLAEGFLAYQWEKDGVIISTAKSNIYTATAPGKYRARFSRISTTPTSTQWNKWSTLVTVTEGTSMTAAQVDNIEVIDSRNGFDFEIFPNPVESGDVNITVTSLSERPLTIRVIDTAGRIIYEGEEEATEQESHFEVVIPQMLAPGLYIVAVSSGAITVQKKLLIANK